MTFESSFNVWFGEKRVDRCESAAGFHKQNSQVVGADVC